MPSRVLLLAFLAACDGADGADETGLPVVDDGEGTVTVTGMGTFGAVGSALWYREVNEHAIIDRVILTTVDAACEKLQIYVAAQNAYNAIDHEGDPDWCANVEDAARAFGAASAAILPTGSHHLSINLADTSLTGSLWAEGTWSETGGSFYGSANYVLDDGLAAYDHWDTSGTWEDGCGLALGGDDIDHALATEATLTVTDVTIDARTSGTFSAELNALQGGEPATAEASFDAVWCPVE